MLWYQKNIGFVGHHPYISFGVGAIISLFIESIIETFNILNAKANISFLGSIGLQSYLPDYVMIVAAIHDLIIVFFPYMMVHDTKNSVKRDYMTANFRAGRQYLNINLLPRLTGIMFIVIPIAGLAPSLLRKANSNTIPPQ